MDIMSADSATVRECHIAVFTGGEGSPPVGVKQALGDASVIIAADSGLHLAVAWQLPVHHVVGDMDSVNPALLAQARSFGATVHKHPQAKDHTDLELALAEALHLGATKITVVGGEGGRLDHLFGAAFVLTAERFAAVPVQAFMGRTTLTVVREQTALSGQVNELVGLFALHGLATGVTTSGLAYPLVDESLTPGSSRGVSNRFVTSTATVAVRDGVLLSVQSGVTEP